MKKLCKHCGNNFNVKDAILDPHWNSWSTEPAYARCPICKEAIPGLIPDSVNFIQHINIRSITVFFSAIVIAIFGLISNTVEHVGPALVLVFGYYLFRNSQLRDHRVIGVVLSISSVILWSAVQLNT